jgi:hypothetical protein
MEHELFLEGLERHKKQWKAIAELVKTRTVVQVEFYLLINNFYILLGSNSCSEIFSKTKKK